MRQFMQLRDSVHSGTVSTIIKPVLGYSLGEEFPNATPMYTYKWEDSYIIEVETTKTHAYFRFFLHTSKEIVDMCWTNIMENQDVVDQLFDELNLGNNVFLFDSQLLLPVKYSDFAINPTAFLNKKSTYFILDMKEGFISKRESILLYIASDKSRYADVCILSLFNEIHTINPCKNDMSDYGPLFCSALASMFHGNSLEELVDEIDQTTGQNFSYLRSRFSGTQLINTNVKYREKYLASRGKFKKLDYLINNVGPFTNLLADDEKNLVKGGSVSLSILIDKGLSRVLFGIPDTQLRKVIKVEMDIPIDAGVKDMYIKDGALFVAPIPPIKDISFFMELVNSEEVNYVID